MDHVGRLFWKRFFILVVVSFIIGIVMGYQYNWVIGLVSYLVVQWFTIPLIIRLGMNDKSE